MRPSAGDNGDDCLLVCSLVRWVAEQANGRQPLRSARLPKAELVNGVFARAARGQRKQCFRRHRGWEREKESVKCKLFTQPLIPGQGAAGQGDTPQQQQSGGHKQFGNE